MSMRIIGLVSATDSNSDDKRYIDDTREEFKWNCLNKEILSWQCDYDNKI